MNLPRDPSARGALALGAAVALATVVASALFDLPYLAAGVAPGLWVALEAGRAGGCRRRPAAPH